MPFTMNTKYIERNMNDKQRLTDMSRNESHYLLLEMRSGLFNKEATNGGFFVYICALLRIFLGLEQHLQHFFRNRLYNPVVGRAGQAAAGENRGSASFQGSYSSASSWHTNLFMELIIAFITLANIGILGREAPSVTKGLEYRITIFTGGICRSDFSYPARLMPPFLQSGLVAKP